MLSEPLEIRTQSEGSNSKEELWAYPVSGTHSTNISREGPAPHMARCSWFDSESIIDETGGFPHCFPTRRIAYIGIAIDCSYRAAFDTGEDVKRNIVDIVNTASVVLENSFNVALALRDFDISDAECSIGAHGARQWNAPCSIEDENAYWTLMTGCAAPVGELGVSWVGKVCKSGEDYNGPGSGIGANVVGHSDTEWQVFAHITDSRMLRHESAHMFDANHDCDSDACASNLDSSGDCCPLTSSSCDAKEDYLMSPIINKGMTGFSACTAQGVCSKIKHADVDTQCLVTKEEIEESQKDVSLAKGECGNGIVEAGEACDCGEDSCDETEWHCCDSCALSQDGGAGSGFSSWLGSHRSLFIGLCAGLGSLLVLLVVLLVFAAVRRKRRKRKPQKAELESD
ncbi:Metallo-peptidase family M12-domain-containing protein [Aspergillus crustosus]